MRQTANQQTSLILLLCVSQNNMNFVRKKHNFNSFPPGQNGQHFADNIFKCIFLNENIWILIKISHNFVPKGQINNIPAFV